MKTYTHPTITMPCGSVNVIFKDPSKSGDVTLQNCIIDIGDVEEGFDYNLGELWVPSCSMRFTHKSNNLLNDMFATQNLEVEITINNELYFIGDIDFESIKPQLYEDDSNLLGEFEVEALHRFARLRNYRMGNSLSGFDPGSLLSDIRLLSDPTPTQVSFATIFQYMAAFMGLKSSVKTDVNYIVHRQYYYTDPEVFDSPEYLVNIDKLNIFRYYMFDNRYNNYYSNRYRDCFGLLGDLAKDFFFYPRIIFDGTDYKLEIVERDYDRTITIDSVKKTVPTTKYLFNQMTTRLNDMPDDFDTTDLLYNSKSTYMVSGETFEHNMLHTNYERNNDAMDWYTNMKFRMFTAGTDTKLPTNIINNHPSYALYGSFTEAIHNAYKNIYLGKHKWREVTITGLSATYSASTLLRHLTPVYKFSLFSQTHKIHSVRKSLKNNESVLTCLIVS